jgi:hypothetical protein
MIATGNKILSVHVKQLSSAVLRATGNLLEGPAVNAWIRTNGRDEFVADRNVSHSPTEPC